MRLVRLRVRRKCIKLTNMRDNLSDYFLTATGARSIRAIAQKAGIDQSTLNRQLSGANTLTVETVISICRAFAVDFADAFVAADFITEEEAQRLGARVGLAAFTDLELSREIVRRIEEATAGEELTGELPVPLDVRGESQDDYEAVAEERTGEDETDEGFN